MLVAGLLILLLLLVLGATFLRDTNIDLQIASNTRDTVRELYVAETGWQEGANWLLDYAKPPSKLNTSAETDNVRNFGNGGVNVLNNDFLSGTQDGTLGTVPYWYKVAHAEDHAQKGSGKDYRDFYYTITSHAGGGGEIETIVRKGYKVGY